MTKWQQLKLGEIATFVNGYAFKPSDWNDTGIPIIRIQNLTNDNASRNYYNGQLDEKYRVVRGDILISWSATIGVFEWTREDSYLNQHIFKVVFNKLKVNKSFFKYLIKQKINEMLAKVHGSTMKPITKSNFDNIPILLPDIKEQDRIARILDKAEEIRTKKKLANEKLDEFLKSTFIDMFGDPVTNPYEYKITNIGEACYFVKDGPHKSPTYVQEGVPFISVNNIISGKWDFSKVKYISKEDHYMFKKRCHAVKGDILYTKGGTTGFAKLVDIDIEFSNWVHLAVLKFDNNILNGKFFEYMLNSKYCYAQSQRRTRGIANRDLVLGEMKKIAFYLPPIEEQKNFERIALKVEAQKEKNQKVIEQMDNLFNSLMQQAFNSSL